MSNIQNSLTWPPKVIPSVLACCGITDCVMYAVVALGGTLRRMPVSETTNLPCCCRCRWACCCCWLAAAAATSTAASAAAATAAAGSLLGFRFGKLVGFRLPVLKLAEGECSVREGGRVGQPSLQCSSNSSNSSHFQSNILV
jgi:hypothetical protein